QPQSLNRYAYVSNDPINNTDPQGSESVQSCAAQGLDYDAGEDACKSFGMGEINVSGSDGETIDPNDGNSDPFSGEGDPPPIGGEEIVQKPGVVPPSPGDPLQLLNKFWKTKAGQHCKEVLGNISLGVGNVLGQLLTNISGYTFIDLHLLENAHYLFE